MTTTPGADELRMRSILRKSGVGPDALSPPDATEPPEWEPDWLDEILDSNATEPEPAEEGADAEPAPPTGPTAVAKPKKPKVKGKKRRKRPPRDPAAPRSAWDTDVPAPRQSLLDAWDRIPYRLKWLGYHVAAAAVGWRIGWVAWATDATAWVAIHSTSPSTWVLATLGCLTWALYIRTRAGHQLAAWAASIPFCSLVVGVLLYGTGYHH